MKRFAFFGLLFVVVGIVTLVATVPLSFVLERTNIASRGISWSAAHGTVWSGRVSGVYHNSQPLGDLRLGLRVGDLLSGRLSYNVDVNGPAARGRGLLDIKNATLLHVDEMNLEVSLAGLHGLDARIRDTGGRLDIRGADILFDQNGCRQASGSVRSDIVTNIAAAFGQIWPEVSGDIRCENGWLLFSLGGAGPQGEVFVAHGKMGPGPAVLEARVDNAGQELGYGLALAGFVPDGAGYAYRQKRQGDEAAP